MTYPYTHPTHNEAQLIRRPRLTQLFTAPDRLLLRFAHTLAIWRERGRQRRALARLDDRLLQDIGVGRAAACREAAKPFWRE